MIAMDDYHRLGKPKRNVFALACGWVGLGYYLKIQLKTNPQWFYQKFLITPWSAVFVVTPLALGFIFYKTQKSLYMELYEKYVGKLSDREMLELDGRLNPNKLIIYKFIIDRNEQRQRVDEEKERLREQLMNNYTGQNVN